MKTVYKIVFTMILSIAALTAAIGVGSIVISPSVILQILGNKLLGLPLSPEIDGILVSILWNVRLPRALFAFFVGAALAVSGTVMQSVLKNPLASSYTLGVSSGASLGAAFIILFGISIPALGLFSLPLAGTVFGLLTVFLAMAFASRLDRHMDGYFGRYGVVVVCQCYPDPADLYLSRTHAAIDCLANGQLFWQ